MFELTIKGTVYPFNLGIGFVREINKTVKVEMSGVKEDAGLTMAMTHLYDGSVIALVDILDFATRAENREYLNRIWKIISKIRILISKSCLMT